MAGRPAQAVRGGRAGEDQVDRGQRDVDRRPRGDVRALGDRCGRLEAPASEFVVDQRAIRERADAVEQAGHREHVRHDVVRAGVVVPGSRPTHVRGSRTSPGSWTAAIGDVPQRTGSDDRGSGRRRQHLVNRVGSPRVLERRAAAPTTRSRRAVRARGDGRTQRRTSTWFQSTPARRNASDRIGLDEHRCERHFDGRLGARSVRRPSRWCPEPTVRESAASIDTKMCQASDRRCSGDEQAAACALARSTSTADTMRSPTAPIRGDSGPTAAWRARVARRASERRWSRRAQRTAPGLRRSDSAPGCSSSSNSELVEAAADERHQDAVAIGELVVQRRHGHPGTVGELAHRQAVEAIGRDDLTDRVQDLGSRALLPRRPTPDSSCA